MEYMFVLAKQLGDAETRVLTADSGVKALEIARREAPDIILLDVRMPGMNGYDVCKTLREESATANIPIVMVTGMKEAEDQLYGLKCGADEYLVKPIDFEWLKRKIESLPNRGH